MWNYYLCHCTLILSTGSILVTFVLTPELGTPRDVVDEAVNKIKIAVEGNTFEIELANRLVLKADPQFFKTEIVFPERGKC